MSFSDEENKLIEDEENKAEEEIKAKFKSFFSEDELNASKEEYVNEEPVEKKQRIYGPGYSMGGHKIMTDSDNNFTASKSRKKSEAYVLPEGVHIFSQDSIPKASNQLTKSAKLNSTRKVRSRVRKLQKAGGAGRNESKKTRGVSYFSQNARSEDFSTAYYYNEEVEPDVVVASGKVNPNTARLSRATIERLLKEEPQASSEMTKDELNIIDAGRQVAERVSQAASGRARSVRRTTPKRKKSSQRVQQARIRSVDNSKKTVRARQRAYQRGKKATTGGVVARIVVLAIIVAFCLFGYLTAKNIFDDSPMNPNDYTKVIFTVDDNTTDSDVADFLVRNNMVESELIYKIRAKIFDADYVNGSYELSPSFSTEKIINTLSGFDYSASNNP